MAWRPGTAGGLWDGIGATFFYLCVYAAATLGAFAVLAYLGRRQQQIETVEELAGLGRTRPAMAAAMAVCMFSLAGLPPAAGLWGKLMLFGSALNVEAASGGPSRAWFIALAIIGVLNAAVAAYYYLRIVSLMYFREPLVVPRTEGGPGAYLAALLCSMAVLVLFVFPGSLMKGCVEAGRSGEQGAVTKELEGGSGEQRVESKEQKTRITNLKSQIKIRGLRFEIRMPSSLVSSSHGPTSLPCPNSSSLLESASQPLYVLDDALAIIYLNEACRNWLGADAEELLGRKCVYASGNELTGLDAAAAGLCPPPAVLEGREVSADVAKLSAQQQDGGPETQSCRRYFAARRFVPLRRPDEEILCIIALVDPQDRAGENARRSSPRRATNRRNFTSSCSGSGSRRPCVTVWSGSSALRRPCGGPAPRPKWRPPRGPASCCWDRRAAAAVIWPR